MVRKKSYVARHVHLNGHTLGYLYRLYIEEHDKQYPKEVELSSFHLCVYPFGFHPQAPRIVIPFI